MGEGIIYAPHLNSSIRDELLEWTTGNGLDVFQYTNRGILYRESLFFNNGDYVTVSKRGKVNKIPYLHAPVPEALDFAILPFTMRSLLGRSVAWVHKKLRSGSYEDVDLDDFGNELDEHGYIDFLQVLSPPRTGKTDYIKCADGQRFVIDKTDSKVLRL